MGQLLNPALPNPFDVVARATVITVVLESQRLPFMLHLPYATVILSTCGYSKLCNPQNEPARQGENGILRPVG